MSRLRIGKMFRGPIPSEAIVQIEGMEGMQEVIVLKKDADRGYLDVFEVARDQNQILVELPRETVNGYWRVWVPPSVVEDAA